MDKAKVPLIRERTQGERRAPTGRLFARLLFATVVAMAATGASAEGPSSVRSPDWKYYGMGDFEGDNTVLFYDAQSIVTESAHDF
jgi:hypothetical protein